MSVTETTQKLSRYDGGTFDVTFASTGARGPGLIVVSSVYGVTPDLRGMMARFAARGFVVAAPEMFSRIGPGPLGQTEAERTQARGRLEGFDYASGMEDVKATMVSERRRPDRIGRRGGRRPKIGGGLAWSRGDRTRRRGSRCLPRRRHRQTHRQRR